MYVYMYIYIYRERERCIHINSMNDNHNTNDMKETSASFAKMEADPNSSKRYHLFEQEHKQTAQIQ